MAGLSTSSASGSLEPAGYDELLEQVTTQVRAARIQAARTVNTELITLYWQIGQLILERQANQGWGAKVISRLADDLRAEFPGMRGFSQRNLVYMRTVAAAFPTSPITQQAVAQLPWGHVTVLLDRVTDPEARAWYAAQAAEHGWSRASLAHHIASGRHARLGVAPNNFPATLPPAESDLPRDIVADPYDLDFLALNPGYTERELEDALVAPRGHRRHRLTRSRGASSTVMLQCGSRLTRRRPGPAESGRGRSCWPWGGSVGSVRVGAQAW